MLIAHHSHLPETFLGSQITSVRRWLGRSKHQIAQKLHAASGVGSTRAHDLIDLQLLIEHEKSVDLGEVKGLCVRLFNYRRLQTWPPTVVENENWDSLYMEAADGIDVLESVSEAVAWANELIAQIEAS